MHFRIVLDFLEILNGKQKSKHGAQYWASLWPTTFDLEFKAAWFGLQAERLHMPGSGGPQPGAGAARRCGAVHDSSPVVR
jgi:hypothetical protein